MPIKPELALDSVPHYTTTHFPWNKGTAVPVLRRRERQAVERARRPSCGTSAVVANLRFQMNNAH